MRILRSTRDIGRRLALLAAAVAVGAAAGLAATPQARRDFSVSAHKYGYRVSGSTGAEIRVRQDDLVRIQFSTDDIPHSFTIDEDPYRINRRAEPDRPVRFEFRADQPGRYRIYCSLKIDERCRDMEGWLIVDPRR